MGFVLEKGARYEMPVTFGPVPLDEIRYDDVISIGVRFRTTSESIERVLPPGLIPAEDPVVTIRRQHIGKSSFLAGKPYNIVSVTVAARFPGADGIEPLDGGYGVVLWEDDVYSIIVGREPFGVPKIYAVCSPIELNDSVWNFSCSEFGTDLIRCRFDRDDEIEPANFEETLSRAGRERINFRYKHIPRPTGGADVSYLMAGNTMISEVQRVWTGAATHEFCETTFESAPVSHRVISALRELEFVETLPSIATFGSVVIQQKTGRLLGGPVLPPYAC